MPFGFDFNYAWMICTAFWRGGKRLGAFGLVFNGFYAFECFWNAVGCLQVLLNAFLMVSDVLVCL